MHFAKTFDLPGSDINSIFFGNDVTLSQQADITWAGACHGNDLLKFEKFINSGVITVLNIDASTADAKTIQWEFLVKTFLTKRRHITNYLNKENWNNIDSQLGQSLEVITDSDRCKKFKEICQGNFEVFHTIPTEIKHTTANYLELFKPGGSYYLCKLLNISTDLRNHNLWNDMLKYSETPNFIQAWGCTWTKQECVID